MFLALALSAFTAIAQAAETVVPYFLSASDPDRQSFVQISWLNSRQSCYERQFSVRAFDDMGQEYGPIGIELPRRCFYTMTFNSDDIEYGNPDKSIPSGLGSGTGDWRLIIESDDAETTAYAYVRTADGFLTAMHDSLVPNVHNVYRASMFNPARNTNQVSSVRIANPHNKPVEVRVQVDVSNGPESDYWRIPANGAIKISAQDLESADDLATGGKRRITVVGANNEQLWVMNLMETPTGHITNLSTFPENEPVAQHGSTSRYDIELVFASDVPDVVKTAAYGGRRVWEETITRDIAESDIYLAAGDCQNEEPFDRRVDDLVIFVAMEEMDDDRVGYGQICTYYTQGGKRFTKAGAIVLNKTRIEKSLSTSCRGSSTCRLKSWLEPLNSYPIKAVAHEIAHVIGFNKPYFEAAGYYEALSPPFFTGPKAIRAYEESSYRGIGGLDKSDGVPLRSDGSHLSDSFITWRRGDPKNGPDQGSPLMGGDMNGLSDLSSITLAALEDLGYRVDMSRAINSSTESQEPIRIQFVPIITGHDH